MVNFDIITIFPKIFDSYLKESLINRAQKKKLIKINIHNLRKYSPDKHKTLAETSSHLAPYSASPRAVVDDRPYGGGIGMVMKIEPIYKAIKALKKKGAKVILFTPRGKKFNQKMAGKFSKMKQIVFICGRYEGVDERVAEHLVDEEVSIGDYVLMGGEIPAITVIETVSRLIPGVLGKPQLLKERVTKKGGFIECPQYTRPENFKEWKVPKVLMSGNHKKIGEWRKEHCKVIE